MPQKSEYGDPLPVGVAAKAEMVLAGVMSGYSMSTPPSARKSESPVARLAAATAVSEQNIVAEACPTSRVSRQLPIKKKSTNQRYTSYRTAVGARIGSACHGARRGVSVEGVAPAQPSVTCRDKQKQKINVGQPSIAAVAVDAVAVVADLAWLQHAVAARGGA